MFENAHDYPLINAILRAKYRLREICLPTISGCCLARHFRMLYAIVLDLFESSGKYFFLKCRGCWYQGSRADDLPGYCDVVGIQPDISLY
jgi:hypothetical protein